MDAARNIIFDARTKGRRTPIALVGMTDTILVQTDDATLLAHKSQAQKIKDLVKKLSESQVQGDCLGRDGKPEMPGAEPSGRSRTPKA